MMDYIALGERKSPAFGPPRYGREFYSGRRGRSDEHLFRHYEPSDRELLYALGGAAPQRIDPIEWSDAHIDELRSKYRGMYVLIFTEPRKTHHEIVVKAFRTPEELEEFELQMGGHLDDSYAMYIPEKPVPWMTAYSGQTSPEMTEHLWVNKNLERLRSKYRGQWIAVAGQEVVAHETDLSTLLKHVDEMNIERVLVAQISGKSSDITAYSGNLH